MPESRNVSDLRLDPKNYRFAEDESGASEARLVAILDEDFDLIEIGKSIADNGFFPQEPLVVVVENGQNIVIEGNRRLAALKLLSQPELRQHTIRPGEWDELAARIQNPITSVPVVFYPSRDSVLPVLGFRHIVGVAKWEPLAKARFIDSIIVERGETSDLEEIADEIGSTSDTVKNYYIAYRAYVQARDEFEIAVSRVADRFSLLYRALNLYDSIATFVGLVWDRPISELRRPIPTTSRQNLAELIGFIYGTEESEAVVRESRKLKELAAVVANTEALRVLRLSRNLAKAFEISGGESRRLLDNLKDANFYLDEALIDVHRHRDEHDVQEAVRRCAGTFYQIVRQFPEIAEEERPT